MQNSREIDDDDGIQIGQFLWSRRVLEDFQENRKNSAKDK